MNDVVVRPRAFGALIPASVDGESRGDGDTRKHKLIALFAGAMLLPAAANAATTIDQRGTRLLNPNTGVLATTGDVLRDLPFQPTTDPDPFDRFIGADMSGPSYSASWAHNHGALQGSVTSAELEFGFLDIDSIATGNQVALFTLNGVDLTAALNAVVEANPLPSARNGLFTLALPSTTYAQLLTGNINFQLNLQNGYFVGQNQPYNSGLIDFAKLTVVTQAAGPGPGPGVVPEPATWAMMIGGFGLVGGALRRRRPLLA